MMLYILWHYLFPATTIMSILRPGNTYDVE